MLKKKEQDMNTTGEVRPQAATSSLLKKRFRLSDVLAEYVIKSVAFLSITFVALIFIFVFRETLPLFHKSSHPVQQSTPGDESMKPETYGTETEVLKPESYGTETESLKPESYVTEENNLKPETYGAVETPDNPASYDEEPVSTVDGNRSAISTLLSKDWQPVSDNPRFGLIPLFLGTFKVTIIAICFAAPVAILAAIYSSIFAPPRLREVIKPAIELLAGFPSVVIGFFALMVLASFFQDVLGYSSRLNGFVGGIAMALAAIPVIFTLTEDALTAVPSTYIEASLGLGASMRQTAFQVLLPAATPGIYAAVILGIGRVFGETMIALMATGNAALISVNPFDSVRTLSATIGAEMNEVVFGDTHYSVLFLIGSLLFIFTFTLNALAEFYFRNRVIKRFQGK
jgi:phosphate transport system permease protein